LVSQNDCRWEDIKFIARRMLILAAEDIGLANPNALTIAIIAFRQ
jgi:putative ATPase